MGVGRQQTLQNTTPHAKRKSARQASFRRDIATLHRVIFARNQQRINESVVGYTPAFRQYENRYKRAVQRYQRRVAVKTIDKAIAAAQVVYVGDYHTLPQSQRSFLRLLRNLPTDRKVAIALEFVQGRHQKDVDAYLQGTLSDDAFLHAIDHEGHWRIGGWEHFKPIFDLARERGYTVLAIDKASRGAAGRSLVARDQYAAQRIAESLTQHPERLVVVLVGELHVAPQHLPEAVKRQMRRGKKKPPQSVIIHQNCEAIYNALQRRGLEHHTEVTQINQNQYCLLNTPPIVCQQSFLNWLDRDDDGEALDTPEQRVREYVQIVAHFFDLPTGDALDVLEVATVVDLSFLRRLQRRGDFSPSAMRQIRAQIMRSESYYIPRAHMVYLGNLSVNHASEEATHFLRHVCSGTSGEPRFLVDAFYARCLEEAVGFLGSKLINHKRKCTDVRTLEQIARGRNEPAWNKQMARLVLRHLRMERGEKVRGMSQVYECDAQMFNAVTHILGYYLGEKLYYGLIDGLLTKQQVRHLFLDTFEEDGAALTTYLLYATRTRDVQLPERW